MMHGKRVFSVAEVPDAATLADKLANHSWCMCTGSKARRRVLSERFHGRGWICGIRRLSRRAPNRVDHFRMVRRCESAAHRGLRELSRPSQGAGMLLPRVQTPAEHGTCRYCR